MGSLKIADGTKLAEPAPRDKSDALSASHQSFCPETAAPCGAMVYTSPTGLAHFLGERLKASAMANATPTRAAARSTD